MHDAEREDEARERSIHDEELQAMRERLAELWAEAERDEPGRDYAANGYGEDMT